MVKPVANGARKHTNESYADRKVRLKAAGQWVNFVSRRASLVAGGMSKKDAEVLADAEFKQFGV